ncbi:MAG: anthranilate synthase component I family protein [Bacteroidota bacterium]|jgi:para-aminobenzoate synthetase component 1
MQRSIIYLNNNDGSGTLAFGEGPVCCTSGNGALNKLQHFLEQHKGYYVFGFLSYDLKDDIHDLHSQNEDKLNFPDLYFWVPAHVVKLNNEHIEFVQGSKDPETLEFINSFLEEETDQNFHHYPFNFTPRIDRQTYISKVHGLQAHIQRGDIYEVNFCQEFYAENVELNYELDSYFKLNQITKAPFSAFVKLGDWVALCGSPERFLKKDGDRMISQPIKGTAARGKTETEDLELKEKLRTDSKERSENIMIVDLVRNDLSQIAEPSTVNVDELCGIYTFETVHQMISTVSCTVREATTFSDLLRATFPMGSMTGAPKYRAMQLIEDFEDFKRGLFSGSIGYIAPNGDFDFNVVIRSMLYNRSNKYLSCAVGSAITAKSDAEYEYEECMVKIGRIINGMHE